MFLRFFVCILRVLQTEMILDDAESTLDRVVLCPFKVSETALGEPLPPCRLFILPSCQPQRRRW